ncbi:hypothetical protein Efla_003443 [Eimeria flavescens]
MRQQLLLEQQQQQQRQQQDTRPTLLRSRGLEAAQQQPLHLQLKRIPAAGEAPVAASAATGKPDVHWQQLQQLLPQEQLQQLQPLQQQQQPGKERQQQAEQKQRGGLLPPPTAAATITAANATAAAAAFSASEQQILREAFAVFDRDGDGLLRPAEFRAACTAVGIETPEPVAAKMLLLEGAAEGLSFAQFCSFAADRFSLSQAETDADGLFNLLDTHHKGPESVAAAAAAAAAAHAAANVLTAADAVAAAANAAAVAHAAVGLLTSFAAARYLTLSDLEEAARCCSSSNEAYSRQQLELMLRHLSPDEAGRVFPQQFKKLFAHKSSIAPRSR